MPILDAKGPQDWRGPTTTMVGAFNCKACSVHLQHSCIREEDEISTRAPSAFKALSSPGAFEKS